MKNFSINTEKQKETLINILSDISKIEKWEDDSLQKILRKYPKDGNKMFRKDELVDAYNRFFKKENGVNEVVEGRIRMKPTRTNSGVVTVTVLTKPYPCPGNCIFCPNDPCMPKSYISSEPGAQRALSNKFDPYAQVYNRLIALKSIGHSIEKVELIVLGGTWNFYVESYQLSFIYECFRALNDVTKESKEYIEPGTDPLPKVSWEDLEEVHRKNESTYCRNVGLVLETRPDYINEQSVIGMRRLGCTKVQMGIQSLSDKILRMNNIGRKNRDTIKAFSILRRMGFKIHGHWMPNLYGSTIQNDLRDYRKLWTKRYSPDELKIYPTSVIENTKLYSLFKDGLHEPYSDDDLTDLLKKVLPLTPRYCRLTRIIRDIPSNEIAGGNRKTNLRQIVEDELKKEGIKVENIRSREIRGEVVSWEELEMERIDYDTTVSREVFLSYKTRNGDRLCGFLRLSLPKKVYRRIHFCDELKGMAIIREVHVYGKVLGLKDESSGESQHLGLGKSLISKAEEISKENGFSGISVISAIGTREYYRKRGFVDGELYMNKDL